jgi:hypothetical protein
MKNPPVPPRTKVNRKSGVKDPKRKIDKNTGTTSKHRKENE